MAALIELSSAEYQTREECVCGAPFASLTRLGGDDDDDSTILHRCPHCDTDYVTSKEETLNYSLDDETQDGSHQRASPETEHRPERANDHARGDNVTPYLPTKCQHCPNDDLNLMAVSDAGNSVTCLRCGKLSPILFRDTSSTVFCYKCGNEDESNFQYLDYSPYLHARCCECNTMLCFQSQCGECDPLGISIYLPECKCCGQNTKNIVAATNIVYMSCHGCGVLKGYETTSDENAEEICRILNRESGCRCGGIRSNNVEVLTIDDNVYIRCQQCQETIPLETSQANPHASEEHQHHDWQRYDLPQLDFDSLSEDDTIRIAKKQEANFKTGCQTPRTQITNVSQLKRGDHVMWKRSYLLIHHAIVQSVDCSAQTINVIEYTGAKNYRKESGAFARIKQTEKIKFEEQTDLFYRIDYDPKTCLPVEKTLSKALSRINEQQYNIFTHNCEHFARWCKTGHAWCTQTSRLAREAGTWVAKAGGKLLAEVGETAVTTAIASVGQGAKVAGRQMLREATKGGVKTLGRRAVAGVAGAGAAVGVELICFSVDAVRSYRALKDGDIDEHEHRRELTRSGCKSLASAVLGGAFAIGFSIIPIPGMTVLGGAIGSLLGSLFGGWVGNKIAQRKIKKEE